MKKKVNEVIAELALPIVEANHYELVDVEFVKEGANWYLRIYIDKAGGITLDDCQVVSEALSAKLDEADPVKQSYFLEVSSPGIDRPLKTERDFQKCLGILVEAKLFQQINGQKIIEGVLSEYNQDQITLKLADNSMQIIDKEKIITVRRVIKF